MLIDHIGVVFFPNILMFRIIGRIAFPLFAYTTMIGYFSTHSIKKYLLRLLIICIISQPIYMLIFNQQGINVMFTLMLEVILLYSIDKKKYFLIPFIVCLSFFINFDYSLLYLLLTLCYYYARNNKFIMFLSLITIYFNYSLSEIIYSNNIPECIMLFGAFSIPLILINTNSHIKINKYFFYIFYPLHLTILLIIKYIFM